MTMAWIDSISSNLLSWLISATSLPDMIAVRCLTFDSAGVISLSMSIDGLLSVMAARQDTRWLLSLSNADEEAFVAVRDNTDGARDTLLSAVRGLKSIYPAFKGLDVRLTSTSDSTHRLAVRDLVTNLFLHYKCGFVQGYYNLTLPAVRETDCTWVYHPSFVGFYNSVTVLFQADARLADIDRIMNECAGWYASSATLLGLPAGGRMYGSDGSISDAPFAITAAHMLGTRRISADQPYAAFAGYYDAAELSTAVYPYVYDYADQSATMRPRALTDATGQSMTAESLSLFALVRRHPPTPVVYWYDIFASYDTLENYNSNNGEYGVEDDYEGESGKHYLAGKGTLLYKAQTFSDFYASLTFLEPSDRTDTFGRTGIHCGNLYVVYNDPYDRLEVYQGPYLNDQYRLATYAVPLERSDRPFQAPHWFRLEVRKRGNEVTVYYAGRPVITQSISVTSGYVGIYSDYTTMCSEFVIGDAYKYDAHESVSLSLAGKSYSFGRVVRTGATWSGSVFTLSGTNEEAASRSVVLDGRLEVFNLGAVNNLAVGADAALNNDSVDPGVELAAIYLSDARGGGVIRFRTSLDLQELYNREVYDRGLGGLALDGLGAEDPAIWGLV